MPIYEYEPTDHDCLICEGRFEVIQNIDDPVFEYCPTCGLPCKRVVSRATFKLGHGDLLQTAAKKGYTAWRKAGAATWEKVAGEGVDVIQGTPEDRAAVEQEREIPRVIDLDKEQP